MRKSKIRFDYETITLSYNSQTQFLPEAQKTLLACRDQLMYSYIFAYYAADSHQKIIFQDNQSNLETAVEKLTHELEAEITHNNFQEIETKVKDQAR